MIDWERIIVLRDEVGAEDFGEVVELFLDEVEEVISRLRATPDMSTLEEDLHLQHRGGKVDMCAGESLDVKPCGR